MLNVRKLLARRVSINHGHGRLLVRITHRNDRTRYVAGLFMCTAVFILFCSMTVQAFLRNRLSSFMDILYLSPFVAFVFVWYIISVRVTFWPAFGDEEILVEHGVMRWTRRALWWVRISEIPASEISEIEAITPWHGFSNRVELTARGRRYTIGDRLLRDEATELARELRHATGLR